MKRFINAQTNKYWEIAYISDTRELIIRTGTIGSKNIGNFNIQSGFDGEFSQWHGWEHAIYTQH